MVNIPTVSIPLEKLRYISVFSIFFGSIVR